jgi:hypothetical protein
VVAISNVNTSDMTKAVDIHSRSRTGPTNSNGIQEKCCHQSKDVTILFAPVLLPTVMGIAVVDIAVVDIVDGNQNRTQAV